MDFDDLTQLRNKHPAWRLLRADSAPLVLSFLGQHVWMRITEQLRRARSSMLSTTASTPSAHAIPSSSPASRSSISTIGLRRSADGLRKFYPVDSDEVHYDATPPVEKAHRWVQELQRREFVGTESRLHTLFDLLRQIVHGSETDPEVRIAELERRREGIDAEIDAVRDEGRVAPMHETAVRERYHQFSSTARELLSNFREVEENSRSLDRSARGKIASWGDSKGELLTELVSTRTDIAASDQGRSFQAFYNFLLSEQRQQELARPRRGRPADARGRGRQASAVHPSRLGGSAERTQQTVRNLSEQLRRFLEEQA